MLLGALRRFLGLFLLASAVTALASVALGAALGASPQRSISLGFYAIGCFLLVSGFFIGNRGPVRPRSEHDGGIFLIPLPFTIRRLRWASAAEREETINLSAVFVSLGFALILVGVGIDGRVDLV
ncbi:MAG: hypothetical protein M3322_07570 [Actinomycetota bacterium]|nr:hypothetical protein [Actinomycetota bacterium]